MYALAVNGSPRKGGNTEVLLKETLAELEKGAWDTELVKVGGTAIRGCIACYKCFDNKDRHCAVGKDMLNDCVDRMLAADGIILGSPVYFACMSPEIKALIDRAGMVSIANDAMLRRKAGAAVVAVRRAGAVSTFDAINHFFTISQMIIPGSQYWNMGFGREKGEVNDDAEGLEIMQTLGENMAWLLKKVAE